MAVKRYTKSLKIACCGLPLAGVAVAGFLPLSALDRQLAILVVLLWEQVFFLTGIFKPEK